VDVQLVIGAGAIGTATAQLLADHGERVRLVTRSGAGPEHPAIERVAADAADADALSRLAEGVAVIYSRAGPAYPRWVTDWPPLAAALLRAAETSGALLVTTGNLYGYGAVDGPMTEGLPLRPNTDKGRVRVRIWNDALEAHRAGRIRTGEVRSSDYLGAGAVTPMTLLVLPKVLAGKRASAPGRPGRAAQLDLHRRRRPHPARRRSGPRILGPGLACADRTAEVVPPGGDPDR
jgi:nucleoside-diphosphate-sugar epimerase